MKLFPIVSRKKICKKRQINKKHLVYLTKKEVMEKKTQVSYLYTHWAELEWQLKFMEIGRCLLRWKNIILGRIFFYDFHLWAFYCVLCVICCSFLAVCLIINSLWFSKNSNHFKVQFYFLFSEKGWQSTHFKFFVGIYS
jgi:hypothetical protein